MRRGFIAGFLACYLLGALCQYLVARMSDATTPAGSAYVAAIWLPFNLLPEPAAAKLLPKWAIAAPRTIEVPNG